MRFKVFLIEDKQNGVGTGCWGHFNIPDEIALTSNYSWDTLMKAIESELSGLLADMLREIRTAG